LITSLGLEQKRGRSEIVYVRILIVDDAAEMRETLQEVLREHGHTVSATSGEHFRVEMAKECDLLVTDLYMPGREGLEIIAELHRIDPYVKILAISGGSAKHLMLKTAHSLGASKVLAKPFTPDEFLGAVKEVLS
jgi:CheY-like chemotaxis protein